MNQDRKERYTNKPYFIGLCILIPGITLMMSFLTVGMIKTYLIPALQSQDPNEIRDSYKLIALMITLLFGGYWACYLASFDILSRYYIEHDELIVKTFLRKRVFLLEEIQEVGIYLDKYRQVWIYFSKEELYQAGWKRVNRRGLSKSFMRVPYSQDNYNYFMDNLPYKPLGKQLSRSHTLIDNYHLE